MARRIIVSPWSRWKENAKNYPYWQVLVDLMVKAGYKPIQVGITGEEELNGVEKMFDKPLSEVERLVKDVGVYICCDNFMHHCGSYLGVRGIVLFGPSDPRIFGHVNNTNIIKDLGFLRPDQFGFYKDYKWPYVAVGWYSPKEVMERWQIK